MAKFTFAESYNLDEIITAKVSALAADTAGLVAGYLTDADVGKGVKLGATDRYILALDGDEIDGFLIAVESATADGYTVGSIALAGRKAVTVVGATIGIGDLVVFGAPVAKGTALAAASAVLVKAGTPASQSGTTPFAYTPRVPNTHLWRLISGTGVAGTVNIIERVGEA